MEYKIGDKVRIHDCEGDPKYNNMIGTVKTTGEMKTTGHPRWDYLCVFDDADIYPFGPREMTRVYFKGEQLLFPFMSEATK